VYWWWCELCLTFAGASGLFSTSSTVQQLHEFLAPLIQTMYSPTIQKHMKDICTQRFDAERQRQQNQKHDQKSAVASGSSSGSGSGSGSLATSESINEKNPHNKIRRKKKKKKTKQLQQNCSHRANLVDEKEEEKQPQVKVPEKQEEKDQEEEEVEEEKNARVEEEDSSELLKDLVDNAESLSLAHEAKCIELRVKQSEIECLRDELERQGKCVVCGWRNAFHCATDAMQTSVSM